jgi:hypothetical protein
MIAASIFDLPELIPDREILEILAQSQAIIPTVIKDFHPERDHN